MAHLLDSNIFLRLAEKESSERNIVLDSLRRLRQQRETIFYTPQVLAEFWNVCTRPASARGGLALSIENTDRKAKIITKYFRILPDNLATFNTWRQLLVDNKVRGVQVHDAKLVASMIVHQVPYLVTLNRGDFERYPMIDAVHPADI